MTTPTITGGCLCGHCRYEAAAQPTRTTVCHCRSCRLAAGAQSVAWMTVASESFRWTQGLPQTHRSSADVTRTFCGTCGCSLTYVHDDYRGTLDITLATVDQANEYPPAHHTWTVDRLSWDKPPAGVPAYARSKADGEPGG